MNFETDHPNSVAASGQNAAIIVADRQIGGALPRRRYAGGISRFVGGLLLVALTTAALAAEKQTRSTEKAREALNSLKTGTPAEKALACKRLAVYGQADAVPALAPLLADEQLAAWARTALEAIPGSAPDKALRDALGKLHGKLLVGVINSIGVRRDAKAVGALAAKLRDADAEVASAAAVALGRIGGDRAAATLEKFLASAPPGVVSAVAQGCVLCAEHYLAANKPAKAVKLYDTVRATNVPKPRQLEAIRGAILARGPDGIPLLLETLRSPDPAVFGIGLRTARELPGSKVAEALAAEFERTPAARQGRLLAAIADRNDAAGLPVVMASAQRGAKPLRLAAFEMMGRLGNVAFVPALLDGVGENDADVADAAKTALGSLPADEINSQIVARLRQASGPARRALIKLAGERQLAAAVPELAKAANDPDATLRAAGIKALGETVSVDQLGALTDLLAKFTTPDDVANIQAALESACARLPDKAACTRKIAPLLTASAPPVQCALLRVLGVVATPRALSAVKTATASPEAAVRDAAIRVLADWSEPAALPALRDLFRNSADETHRFLALRGCVRLLDNDAQPAAEKVEIYRELLAGTQRADDRKAILSGLANVADPGALQLLRPLLEDTEVKVEAKMAADKITAALNRAKEGAAKAKP